MTKQNNTITDNSNETQNSNLTVTNESTSYVVVRNGIRVSDKEYSSDSDPEAFKEREFWKSVVKRHPDGSLVEIVTFDKKKHRIW